MVLELPWAQKRTLWAFEKIIFQFFANFRVKKLKPLSRKVRQSVQNYLNQNLIIGNFLENRLEATLSSKANALSVWKKAFFSFWLTKLKLFSGKVGQSVQSYLNQNLGIRTFIENGFQATSSSKTNVLNAWKKDFPVFCKFLSD